VDLGLGRLRLLIECAAYVGLAIALRGMAFFASVVSTGELGYTTISLRA
jgi:hypothetical protein